jgi:hypothetical protein
MVADRLTLKVNWGLGLAISNEFTRNDSAYFVRNYRGNFYLDGGVDRRSVVHWYLVHRS